MRNTSQNAPRTVAAYLTALRDALAGAPKGLIQDALSDAEEHLRNEIAQNPDKGEAEILVQVISAYGSPREIAAEYLKLDGNGTSSARASTPQPSASLFWRIFGVLFDFRTYGALLYMLLALATGIAYFTWTVTGISLSAGLMILIIGLPFTIVFIFSIRLIALVEGRIVEALLGVRMPRRLPSERPSGTILQRIKGMLLDRRTWTTMFYMVLMLPLGTAYFSFVVTGGAFFSALIAGPIIEKVRHEDLLRFGNTFLDAWTQTPEGMAACIAIGVVGMLVFLHLVRGIGRLHGKLAENLLVKI